MGEADAPCKALRPPAAGLGPFVLKPTADPCRCGRCEIRLAAQRRRPADRHGEGQISGAAGRGHCRRLRHRHWDARQWQADGRNDCAIVPSRQIVRLFPRHLSRPAARLFRFLVHRSVLGRVADGLITLAKTARVGNPAEITPQVEPIPPQDQRAKLIASDEASYLTRETIYPEARRPILTPIFRSPPTAADLC